MTAVRPSRLSLRPFSFFSCLLLLYGEYSWRFLVMLTSYKTNINPFLSLSAFLLSRFFLFCFFFFVACPRYIYGLRWPSCTPSSCSIDRNLSSACVVVCVSNRKALLVRPRAVFSLRYHLVRPQPRYHDGVFSRTNYAIDLPL